MNRTQVHRGPDDGGEWRSETGEVGLASRRLAILDRSAAGHQPMLSFDGRQCIAYNGEIYNYVELRDELSTLGHSFRSHTDTEVILVAYAQWGDDCVQHFNGMFAFAIWDAPRQRLFAARDRFGEKPFFYAQPSGRFVFASEIKALLVDPGVPRRLDDIVVARYLTLALVDCDERTFFRDVRRLPAAHTLTVDRDGRVSIARYWDLPIDDESAVKPRGAQTDAFRSLLTDAVRIRLRSDVAVGSSLSGGMDSSSIVCIMRSLLGDQPAATQKTFSARYRGASIDEGRFIDEVAKRTGVEAHHVFIEGSHLVDDLDRFIWHQDEPVAHSSPFAQWKVAELARDANVTVMLDGQGADEIIGGYPSPTFGYRYAELLRGGHLVELARELVAFGRHHGNVTDALRYLGAAVLPASIRDAMRTRFLETSGLVAGGANHPPAIRRARSSLLLRNALYQILTVTSLPGLLRYADRNSMAFSREARLPFLDHRLVEFAYKLPSDALVQDGTTKVILRQAMAGLVPDAVRQRTDKIGFATPERDWLVLPLRERIEEALSALKRRGVVPAAAIDHQWHQLLAGGGQSGNVWRLANLELWMQQFIDRTPSPPTLT